LALKRMAILSKPEASGSLSPVDGEKEINKKSIKINHKAPIHM